VTSERDFPISDISRDGAKLRVIFSFDGRVCEKNEALNHLASRRVGTLCATYFPAQGCFQINSTLPIGRARAVFSEKVLLQQYLLQRFCGRTNPQSFGGQFYNLLKHL